MWRFRVWSLTIAVISLFAIEAEFAHAACTIPNQLSNGQPANASEVMEDFNSLLDCISAASSPNQEPPQGRLTLTSNTPVMTADATAQTSIYYTPYQGNLVPVAGIMYPFSQLSYSLSTTVHLADNLYDIFAYDAAGSVALCTGPNWTSTTARSAAITTTNGIWTNASSLICTLSGGVSSTSISSGNATYLGTFYTTANGQTAMQFAPAATAGGTRNILGLWNAYNRVLLTSQMTDSNSAYSPPANSTNPVDDSDGTRITYIDGLGQSYVDATINFQITYSSGSYIGLSITEDNTSSIQPNNVSIGREIRAWDPHQRSPIFHSRRT